MISNEVLLQGLGVVMDDIGGLVRQKQLLKELVVYPLQNHTMDGE